MEDKSAGPKGSLLLCTLAMPADTNPSGDIFGGWVLSQMDIAGGILATDATQGRTVTVAVEGMKFFKPIRVGDVVSCYGRIDSIGNTSITLFLEIWVKPPYQRDAIKAPFKVTEGRFAYVAVDEKRQKRLIPRT